MDSPEGAPTRGVYADPGLWARVAQTFAAPRALFERFAPNTPWIGVLALSTLVAIVAAGSHPAEFYLEQVEDPVTRLGEPVEITSDPAEIVRYGRLLAMFSALASHPLIAFALGGLLTLLFTVLGGGRGSFRAYLAVAAHALLIPALGSLVALALWGVTGDPDAQPTLARLLSPFGIDPATSPFLDSLNLFSLWMLVVLAVAVAAIDGKRSWPRASAVLVGAYLLLSGVTTLLPN